MKTKYFFSMSAGLVGLLAIVGIRLQEQDRFSDVALANIEALASGEDSSGSLCYQSISSVQDDPMNPEWITVPYCENPGCGEIRCARAWDDSNC